MAKFEYVKIKLVSRFIKRNRNKIELDNII